MADPADLFREAKSQRSGSVLSLDAIQKVDEESPHQQFEWMNSLLLLDGRGWETRLALLQLNGAPN